MEPELDFLAALFPSLSAQLRIALQNVQLSAARLAPAEARERDPELDREAARLDQSYYQLLRLTNCLTAAAWLGRSKSPQLRNLDLVELVQQIFASAESLASRKGLAMTLSCPKDSHLCAGSREGLTQALYQLLSNAFKFTPAGGTIALEVKFRPGFVLLTVADTGCGMDDDALSHLFDRCLEPEDLAAVPPQGLGLGLMLVQAIARAHGGTVLADSAPGKGSRFTLSLPDRLTEETGLSDVAFDYTGGFNEALMYLADALPVEAFLVRSQ